MRSILSFITSLTILIPTIVQGQWEVVNKGMALYFSDVDFISRDTGWVAGWEGLFKTFDGAETWNVVNHANFTLIDFCNAHTGWAFQPGYDIDNIEFDGGLFKTLDGGVNWFEPGKIGDVNGLCAISDSVVYVFPGHLTSNRILKTIDGGISWEDVSPDQATDLRSLCFHSPDTGYVQTFDGVIFRTFNGGSTWDSIYTGYEYILNLKLLNGTSGYFIARNDTASLICKTTDAFTSWSVVAMDTVDFLSCHFFDEHSIIAFKDNENRGGGEPYIIKSADGGMTWEVMNHLSFRPGWWALIRGLEIIGVDEVAYLFAQASGMTFILKGTDHGSIWNHLNLTFPMTDVHFIDRYTGFVSGSFSYSHSSAGFLLKTRDGGETWSAINWKDAPELHFLNDSLGYSYGSWEGVFATRDGGENWVDVEGLDIRDMHTLNDSVSWLMDRGSSMDRRTIKLLRTMDGGHAWDTIIKFREPIYGNYVSFGLLDESTGCVVGEEGRIQKFSANGQWDAIESGTTLPLNKVVFVDQKYGLITGGYANDEAFMHILLLSEDGGDHWTEGPEIPYLIHDLQFIDSLNGFAVGEDSAGHGVLLETFDRGVSWDVMILGDDSLSVLRALYINDSIGWAVGDNSLILTNKPIAVNNTGPKAEPFREHFLSYPNPFRSRTIIYYWLPASMEVELSIFDLSGRKITTLLNETQMAGKHEISWDAGRLNPGIYFCELITGSDRQGIKMILVE